ncbi:hypothetical protein Tco_0458816 [Tanacetum coccineum]
MMIKEGTGNEEEMRLNLDLLQERREKIAIRKAKCKMKIEHYYNKRVRPVSFKIGDYVYQKNKANRVENLGKLGLKWEGRYLSMDDEEVPLVDGVFEGAFGSIGDERLMIGDMVLESS